MKKILFLIAVCFAFISCNMNAKNGTEAQTQKEVSKRPCRSIVFSWKAALRNLYGYRKQHKSCDGRKFCRADQKR